MVLTGAKGKVFCHPQRQQYAVGLAFAFSEGEQRSSGSAPKSHLFKSTILQPYVTKIGRNMCTRKSLA